MHSTPTIYTAGAACHACTLTERAFRERGLDPAVVPADSPAGQRALDRALAEGHPRQAPIVEFDDRLWTGFRPDEIRKVSS